MEFSFVTDYLAPKKIRQRSFPFMFAFFWMQHLERQWTQFGWKCKLAQGRTISESFSCLKQCPLVTSYHSDHFYHFSTTT